MTQGADTFTEIEADRLDVTGRAASSVTLSAPKHTQT